MSDRDEAGEPRPGDPDPRPEIDIDSAFAAIIADFEDTVPRGSGPWPASEDLDDDDTDTDGTLDDGPDAPAGATPDAGPAPRPTTERREPPRRRIVLPDGPPTSPAAGTAPRPGPDPHGPGPDSPGPDGPGPGPGPGPGFGPRDYAVDDEDDDGYVPPLPPPLPRGDLVSRLAWGGVLGGPLFLLVAALAWRWQTLPSFLLFLALVAFVGGFVTLVARMPADRPDDPDDGAVV